jgi:hypothetical protein
MSFAKNTFTSGATTATLEDRSDRSTAQSIEHRQHSTGSRAAAREHGDDTDNTPQEHKLTEAWQRPTRASDVQHEPGNDRGNQGYT